MHTHDDGEYGRSRAVGGGADAWDDSALVRAYDDAIARYGQGDGHASPPTRDVTSPSSSDARPRAHALRARKSAPEAASGERPRAPPQPPSPSPPPPHHGASPSRAPYDNPPPHFDPRMFEQRHGYRRPGPQPEYYYADYDYAPPPASSSRDGYYHHARYPPPPPRHYDPYDAYSGESGEHVARHPPFEDEFAQFSPFRGPRSPRGAGPPPPPHRYPPPPHSPRHYRSPRGPPRPEMGPPRAPPDMTESAYETAHSYADDGYDPDELANLLLAWYYAGYYTGSFSRKPDREGAGAHE